MSNADEDGQLHRLGYTQQLNRSVGGVSSFFLGFSVISATTAVFSGFGFGLGTAGPAFVWTFPIATLVFFVWAAIAADLVSKLPLSGYAYQWTSRLVGPALGWFTGFAGAVGFISGFTGVAYVMAGYLGSLFDITLSTGVQIWVCIAIVLLCVVINVYGVRLATILNNVGVGLELLVTLGATIFIAVVTFTGNDHQAVDFLFSSNGPGGTSPYVVLWLTSSLGCIFGLLGVEAAADVAEETKNARRTIPRTMFLALGTAAVIEFFMYIVFLLAIKDPSKLANSGSPIADIIAQQTTPWFAKVVVAVALTNILVCVLANMLVATRVVFAMGRDNMLPGSKWLRHVSPTHRVPTHAVWATGIIAILLLVSAFANAQAFSYIIGMSALGYFTVYVITTVGLVIARKRGRIPVAEADTFDLGRLRLPMYIIGLILFGTVLAALLFLPDFRPNAIVFAIAMALSAIWYFVRLRTRIRRGDAGPAFAIAVRDATGPAAIIDDGRPGRQNEPESV